MLLNSIGCDRISTDSIEICWIWFVQFGFSRILLDVIGFDLEGFAWGSLDLLRFGWI